MPVGQEVTATIRNGRSDPPDSWPVLPGAVPAEAAAGTAPVSVRSAGSSGESVASDGAGSSPRISAAAAAASPAERSAAVNSAFINCRASEERIVRWASSAPAGAAIRKIRSAGPSAAPKSTPAALRPKARVGSVTCSLRQCGMPMPPSRPVGICASRAATSARKPSRSVTRPRATIRSARARAAASLVSADRSRSTRSAVIMSLIAGSLARVSPGTWGEGRGRGGGRGHSGGGRGRPRGESRGTGREGGRGS
ncbi:hypothetical protein RKD31_003458 [Streptomyces sp. SAI-163]